MRRRIRVLDSASQGWTPHPRDPTRESVAPGTDPGGGRTARGQPGARRGCHPSTFRSSAKLALHGRSHAREASLHDAEPEERLADDDLFPTEEPAIGDELAVHQAPVRGLLVLDV